MKLKTFLKRIREEEQGDTIFGAMDMAKDLIDIEALLNNFKILYGVDVELDFKTPKPITGKRWYGKGIVEELINLK